jgi:hypothetical protein
MKAFLKRIVKIFVGLIVVLLVLLVVLFIFMGSIVEKGINSAAPALLGVNTHVDSVSISPIKGVVHLKNLTLANPEGYTQEKKLFEVNEFYVNVNMASLFSDTIRVRKILIKGPGCTYEVKDGTSNIDALIAKLNKGKPADPKAKTEEPAHTGSLLFRHDYRKICDDSSPLYLAEGYRQERRRRYVLRGLDTDHECHPERMYLRHFRHGGSSWLSLEERNRRDKGDNGSSRFGGERDVKGGRLGT